MLTLFAWGGYWAAIGLPSLAIVLCGVWYRITLRHGIAQHKARVRLFKYRSRYGVGSIHYELACEDLQASLIAETSAKLKSSAL